MNKLLTCMIVLAGIVFTGCSSSSYPSTERYPDRVVVHQGYYPQGYYGPYYYGGGYYPPSGIYRNQYSRRRPAVVYRTPTPRVIKVNPPRVNPNNPSGNWNRGKDSRRGDYNRRNNDDRKDRSDRGNNRRRN